MKLLRDETSRQRKYASDIVNPRAWADRGYDLADVAKGIMPRIEEYWTSVAALQRGEQTLLPRRNPHGVYFMLMGFALENFMKARLVIAKRREIEAEVLRRCKLPKELDSHDLQVLATAAGLTLSPAEEALLQRLSQGAVWYGRYPVPKSPNRLEEAISYSRGDVRQVQELAKRAMQGLPPPAA